jgi:mobilome CxxCx(11)CxxC protein
MLKRETINTVYQKRMDALATKHLHEYLLSSLSRLNLSVDFLAIGVPILYFPICYFAKGTLSGSWIEIIWELLASILLVLALAKTIWKWQDLAVQHSKLLGENITLASQAENILTNTNRTPVSSAQWFFFVADNLEKADREVLGRIRDKDKQLAYREALKEFNPGSTTVCQECGASPWKYTPGSCQVCGNTPVANR